MAVLEKRLGMQLGNCDAYVNIAGGIRINEPAIDLGIAMAVISSFKNIPIDDKIVAVGEIGLSGEIRSAGMIAMRVNEVKKLGFETVIVPKVCMDDLKDIKGIKIIPVSNVQDISALEI